MTEQLREVHQIPVLETLAINLRFAWRLIGKSPLVFYCGRLDVSVRHRCKQFAEIHYRIRVTQSELDVLQRELNEALLIYDPNPQKAMRENVTRNNINAHRQAIEDKRKELIELRRQLSDLEDELRHAGGDPGWSRE
jgi:hypothetical protein